MWLSPPLIWHPGAAVMAALQLFGLSIISGIVRDYYCETFVYCYKDYTFKLSDGELSRKPLENLHSEPYNS